MRHHVSPTRSSPEVAPPATAMESRATAGVRAAKRGDRPAYSSDEDGHGAFFDAMPAMLVVLRMAREVEADPVAVASWYRDTRIAEFGDLTAAQLVAQGRADDVIMFLHAVRNGRRG